MNTKSRTEKATGILLVLIVLAVGGMAGAASWHHVHDWTLDNSPAGTGSWFGWANAVITELIPTASLIIIGQRRKAGKQIGYPMFLLVVAVCVSLTAQLAEAVPTVFGWMSSALPALAFFALAKLVFHNSKPTPVASVDQANEATEVAPALPFDDAPNGASESTVEAAPEPQPVVATPKPSDTVRRSVKAVNFLKMAEQAESAAARKFWRDKYEAEMAAYAA